MSGPESLSEPMDLARVAFEELLRREQEGKLPAPERNQIIEMALAAERAPGPVTPVQFDLMWYLSKHVLSGEVSADQQRRFFETAAVPHLVARPRVVVGERVPLRLSNPPWKPSSSYNWAVTELLLSVKLDGKPVELSPAPAQHPVWLGRIEQDWSIPAPPLGHHDLMIAAQFDVHDGASSYEPDHGTIVHSARITVSAPFDVEPPGPSNAVGLVNPPGMAEKVDKSIIRLSFPLRVLYNVGQPGAMYVEVPLANVPVNLAYRAFARYGGRDYPIAEDTATKGQSFADLRFRTADGYRLPTPPARIDVVLRPSLPAARATVDLDTIWSGTLELKQLPVIDVTKR